MASVSPFMTIYTPTFRRPNYLRRCRESVQAQTIYDSIQHLIVEDTVGIGVSGMYREIPGHAGEMTGQYIYILQDDDILAADNVAELVQAFAIENDHPPVIICRNTKNGFTYPLEWRSEPLFKRIDLGNFVVRRDVFLTYVSAFAIDYSGDYPFIRHLWDEGLRFTWLDILLAQAQALGLGRPEVELNYTGVKMAVTRKV